MTNITKTERINNKSKLSNDEIHIIGVNQCIDILTKKKINTHFDKSGNVDLILDNGETILIRSKTGIDQVQLANEITELRSNYIIIVTDILNEPKFYIITSNTAKNIMIRRDDGREGFVIRRYKYTQYQNNYTIITDNYDTLSEIGTLRIDSTMTEDEKESIHERRKNIKISKAKDADAKRLTEKAAERAAFRADYEQRHNIN